MKRVEEGDRRGQSKPAGGGKTGQFFSYLCQLHTHLSWGLGMQSAVLASRKETRISKKRHKQKRTKWNKSHIRRTYTRCMCGNSERKEALGSQGCFTERRGASQDWKAAAKHKHRMARQQGGLGEELTPG